MAPMPSAPSDPRESRSDSGSPRTEDTVTRRGLRGTLQRWAKVNTLTKPVRLHVSLVAVAAVGTGLVEAAFLVAVARIALVVAGGGSEVALTRGVTISLSTALLIAGTVLLARLAMALASVRIQMGLSYRITTSLRTRLARAYLGSSWSMQQQQPAGTLQQLVVTFPNTAGGLVNALAHATGAALSLLAMLAVAVVVDPATTGIIVVALVLLSTVLRPIRGRIQRRSEAALTHQVAFANGVAQVSELGLEIQAFGVREPIQDDLEDLIHDYAAADRRVGLFAHAVSPIYVSLGYAAVVAALAIIAAVSAGALESVGAVMLIMLRSLGYGQIMQNGSAALFQVLPFIDKLEGQIAHFTSHSSTNGDTQIDHLTPIEFQSVSFAYRPDEPVLTDLSLQIEPGEVIGIIGPSGGGKSTLVQLMLGVREPDSGEIVTGGVPLRQVDRTSLAPLIAFVPQDPLLITGTVAENVRFFRESITDADIRRALEQAHLTSEVDALPEGIHTYLGERGQELSGGQRQRISIARALAASPQLLIMDEPTSALDMRAEAAIRDTIAALKGSVTVVIIAHRVSTLEACDRLMVIQKGQITAFASPQELANNSSFYRETLALAGIT